MSTRGWITAKAACAALVAACGGQQDDGAGGAAGQGPGGQGPGGAGGAGVQCTESATVTFEAGVEIPLGALTGNGLVQLEAASADLDGDLDADVVVAEVGSGELSVLLGAGDGAFELGQTVALGPGAFSMHLRDVNHDGHVDVALVTGDGAALGVLLGRGDGTLQDVATYAAGPMARTMAIGDFNGDGDPDIASASPTGIAVLLGNGDATFQTGPAWPASDLLHMAAADLNRDGSDDLAVATLMGTLAVYLSGGDGSFQPPALYAANGDRVYANDLDDDGNADLVTTISGSLSTLRGRGDGTFEASWTFNGEALFYALAGDLADFDCDGALDIAVIQRSTSNFVVLLGEGDVTFRDDGLRYTLSPGGPDGIAAADLDGDGRTDLALATSAGLGTSGAFLPHLNSSR